MSAILHMLDAEPSGPLTYSVTAAANDDRFVKPRGDMPDFGLTDLDDDSDPYLIDFERYGE